MKDFHQTDPNLMENMKLTLEQALNALGIQGDERRIITNKLQK